MQVTMPQYDGFAPQLLRHKPRTAALMAQHRAMAERCAVAYLDSAEVVRWQTTWATWECFLWTEVRSFPRHYGLVPMTSGRALLVYS